jgi:peptide deformylase
MEIKLLKENDDLLKQVAEPWDFTNDGDPTELIKALSKTMLENNGIGLAAPQCGILKRIFVMGNEQKLIACINPELLEGDNNNTIGQEGCLSFPNLWLNVKRHNIIQVKYYTATGEEVVREFSGLISRVFQHERDHLDGICFDTKVGKLSLELAKKRRKKRKK